MKYLKTFEGVRQYLLPKSQEQLASVRKQILNQAVKTCYKSLDKGKYTLDDITPRLIGQMAALLSQLEMDTTKQEEEETVEFIKKNYKKE